MKIPQSIRSIYQDLEYSYSKLKKLIDDEFKNTLPQEWHYISRLKKDESFTLKVESGRYKTIDAFDDLRMYMKWKDKIGSRPTGLDGLLFEVQIKTFLQHAWAIATHDLIYKSDEKNWAKERIAYQVKAMLEHAEVSINEADQLSKSSSIKKSNPETKKIKQIIKVLKEMWPAAALPQNLKLLAINLKAILKELNLTSQDLRAILKKETEENLGVKALNLSPFGIVIQALFNQQRDKMCMLLSSEHNRISVFIHQEVNIPSELDLSKFNNNVSYT